MDISRKRLADLLVDPGEDLDFEIKNWLDLQNSNDDKATFAKAVLAISNHGGGFIVLGLVEINGVFEEAPGRPVALDGYSQDIVNGIVQNYCDPPFHCSVHVVPSPTGIVFPIVTVPGGHRMPIRARRAGPNGNTVTNNAIYVRKAGPRSEVPQSAQDWDDLLARCLRNRRDEMFDQIRGLLAGAVPQAALPPEPAQLDAWTKASRARWEQLIEPLPPNAGPRMPYGRFCISYEIIGENRRLSPARFASVLRESVIRHTGWPLFLHLHRDGVQPYPIDGAIECWVGSDPTYNSQDRGGAYADFWRVNSDGFAFLLRGFQEDDVEDRQGGPISFTPGKVFDLTLPVWRVGEALLHAKSLSDKLFEGPTTLRFVVAYEGLAGRRLVSLNGRRHITKRVAVQNAITLTTHVETPAIDVNLPEIVHPLLAPLYALFDFFDLPMSLVSEELARLRSNNF